MDAAFPSAVSPLSDCVVGGLISGIETWASQRFQTRASQLSHEISLRRGLYIVLSAVAPNAYGDLIVSDQSRIEERATLQAMITRIVHRIFGANYRVHREVAAQNDRQLF
jgi:hypothetical protein